MNSIKQIEEMAYDLRAVHSEFVVGEDVYTDYDGTARGLVEKGYRKQSENVVELPCNIGDSCYPSPRSRKPIVERKVSRITFTKRNIIIGYYENDGQYRPPLRTRTLGEDVFLTKEEAEAKTRKEDEGK